MDPITCINEEGIFNPEIQAQQTNPCLLDLPGTLRDINQDDPYPPEFHKEYPPLHACPADMVRTFTMVVGVVDQYASLYRDWDASEKFKRETSRLLKIINESPSGSIPTTTVGKEWADGVDAAKERKRKTQVNVDKQIARATYNRRPDAHVRLRPSFVMNSPMNAEFDPFCLDYARSLSPGANLTGKNVPTLTYKCTARFTDGGNVAHGKATWSMTVNLQDTTTQECLGFISGSICENSFPGQRHNDTITCMVYYDGYWAEAKSKACVTTKFRQHTNPFPKERSRDRDTDGSWLTPLFDKNKNLVPNGHGRFSIREEQSSSVGQSYNPKVYAWKVLAEGDWWQGVLNNPNETVGIMSGCTHGGRYADFKALVTMWASMRMWRVSLACGLHAAQHNGGLHVAPMCAVERWEGHMGDDGFLKPYEEGDTAHDDTTGWVSHAHIPVKVQYDDTEKDPTIALDMLRARYFINRGLEGLIECIWDMDYKNADWLSSGERSAPVTWFNLTQGLPDAAVFDVNWITIPVDAGPKSMEGLRPHLTRCRQNGGWGLLVVRLFVLIVRSFILPPQLLNVGCSQE